MDNSFSVSEEDMPVFTNPENIDPDVMDSAAHSSFFKLPQSLIGGKLTGPGKEWLGLPVGLFTADPFNFTVEESLGQRLPYYRVVSARFTTSVTIR